MDTETYKKQSSTKEQLLKKLKETRVALTDELCKFAKSWIDHEIMRTLKKQPDKFFSINIKKRKKLKAKLINVKETVPIRVAKYLDKDSLWMGKDIAKNENVHKLPEKIDLEFKFALGELGKVLAAFDIVQIRYSDADWIKDILRKNQVRYNNYIYIEGCAKLKTLIENYIALLKEYHQVNESINHLESEMRAEKIEAWWEERR
ncbi:hypothetical protein [Bacillus siamensis]|uniref:hypothetical protein n=1 Tax=Bacillus siamensis TaxID=659243 RepID=UPI002E1BF5A1|nr:hypothetical protein [Bacillus siamensis]